MFKQGRKFLFATDVDGTLLDGASRIPDVNLRVLRKLGDYGVVRAVVTGRSLEIVRRALLQDAPIDYVVFSSGAGICKWPGGALLHENHMSVMVASEVLSMLRSVGLSFMAQLPIPHSHRFYYEEGCEWARGDFHSRLEAYRELAEPLGDGMAELQGGLSQFLVTIPGDEGLYSHLYEMFRSKVEVIRATSPFDGSSIWMELFPLGVSKGSALQWLIGELGIEENSVGVVGNDYNDLSMLRRFAGHAFVVKDSPHELREEFRVVNACSEGGMAEAAELWWGEMMKGLERSGL